jgi:hypothetical protein
MDGTSLMSHHLFKQEATLLLACKIMEVSDLRFKGIQQWIDRCRENPDLRIIGARLDIVTKSDNSKSEATLSKKVIELICISYIL